MITQFYLYVKSNRTEILIGCLVIIAVFFTDINIRCNFSKKNHESDILINNIISDVVTRDSLSCILQHNIKGIVSKIETVLPLEDCDRENLLYVFIPEELCWSCKSDELFEILKMIEKFTTKLIIICHNNQKSNFIAFFSANNIFDVNVICSESIGIENIVDFNNKTLYLIVNNEKNVIIPYFDMINISPIKFIEKYYYENRK